MYFPDLGTWLEYNVELISTHNAEHTLGLVTRPQAWDGFNRTGVARECAQRRILSHRGGCHIHSPSDNDRHPGPVALADGDRISLIHQREALRGSLLANDRGTVVAR
jgi:hypothetical protein